LIIDIEKSRRSSCKAVKYSTPGHKRACRTGREAPAAQPTSRRAIRRHEQDSNFKLCKRTNANIATDENYLASER
jgi:hypothetical protein